MRLDIPAFVVFCAQNFVPFVKDYQTLIGGVLAILAAFIAARPVWLQLRQMNVETNAVFREFLVQRIRGLSARHAELHKLVAAYEDTVSRQVYHVEELQLGDFNETWAFDRYQDGRQLRDALGQYLIEHREPEPVDAAITAVVGSLESLLGVLDAIHRPAHTDQHDEDHSMTDEEWAAFVRRGEEARDFVPSKSNSLSASMRGLNDAFNAELAGLRDRLRAVDQALLKQA